MKFTRIEGVGAYLLTCIPRGVVLAESDSEHARDDIGAHILRLGDVVGHHI